MTLAATPQLGRLRRQIAHTTDPELTRLYTEVRAFPCADGEPDLEPPGPSDVVVPLRFRYAGQELAFFSTVPVFGTPLDITVDELAIELFFPSDEVTAAFLKARFRSQLPA